MKLLGEIQDLTTFLQRVECIFTYVRLRSGMKMLGTKYEEEEEEEEEEELHLNPQPKCLETFIIQSIQFF